VFACAIEIVVAVRDDLVDSDRRAATSLPDDMDSIQERKDLFDGNNFDQYNRIHPLTTHACILTCKTRYQSGTSDIMWVEERNKGNYALACIID
jgi:hypothetical protein